MLWIGRGCGSEKELNSVDVSSVTVETYVRRGRRCMSITLDSRPGDKAYVSDLVPGSVAGGRSIEDALKCVL